MPTPPAPSSSPPVVDHRDPGPAGVETLDALVRHRAEHDGERPFVTFLADGDADARRLSFGDLGARALAVAGALAARGLSPGDRVLIMLPSGLEFIEAFFGVLTAGMVPVPVYPPARLARLEHYLRTLASITETAGCRAVVVDERLVPLVGRHVTFKGQTLVTDAELRAAARPGRAHPLEPGSPAFLQFTSGTTSQPRGVLLLQRHVLAQLRSYAEALRIAPDEPVVSWLPLYHDLGLIGKVLAALYARAHLVLLSPIDFLKEPMTWLRAISRHRAVHAAAPNFAYDLCVRKCPPERLRAEGIDLSSLDNAGMGGEPVSWATVERFRAHFAPFGLRGEVLNPCYGLAENTLVATGHRRGEALRTVTVSQAGLQRSAVAPPEDGADAFTLVGNGAPFPGVSISIRGEDGADLGPDAIGEVWVRGPSLAVGYTGDREATAETFVTREDGRWLRTGDLGFLSGGDLYVCGRRKDLMIVRGRNFHPQDLEAEAGRVEGVRTGNVAAFSVEGGDGRGEVAVLVAELDPRATRPADAVRREVVEAVSAAFQLGLEEVVLVPKGSVPKTSSGKIQRSLVRDAYARGDLAKFAPPGRLASAWLKARVGAAALGRRLRRAGPASDGADAGAAPPPEADEGELDPRFGEALRAVGARVDFQLRPSLRLDGLGLDSLERVELWLQLERQFAAKVPEAEWSASQTLGELQALLERHAGEGGPEAGEGPSASSLLVRELLAAPETAPEPFRPPATAPVVFGALHGLSRLFWGWRVAGQEHLEREDGFVLAGNHATYLDGAWLRNATPPDVRRRLVAYRFAGLPRFTHAFLAQIETIAVDEKGSFREPIRAGVRALGQGKVVLIYPEGLRTHSGRMGVFRPGVGLLSLVAQRPIVPFRSRGTFEVYPRDRTLPRFVGWRRGPDDRVEFRFGPPIHPPPLDPDRAWEQAVELVRRLRAAVEAL